MAYPQWMLREDGETYDLFGEGGEYIGVYTPDASGRPEGEVRYASGKKGRIREKSSGKGIEVQDSSGKTWATWSPKAYSDTSNLKTRAARNMAKEREMRFQRDQVSPSSRREEGGGGGLEFDRDERGKLTRRGKGQVAGTAIGAAAATGLAIYGSVKAAKEQRERERKAAEARGKKAYADWVERNAPMTQGQDDASMNPGARIEAFKQNVALDTERQRRPIEGGSREQYDKWYRDAANRYAKDRKVGTFSPEETGLTPEQIDRYERTYRGAVREGVNRPEWKGLKTDDERHEFIQGETLYRMGEEGKAIGDAYKDWRGRVNQERKRHHLPPISQNEYEQRSRALDDMEAKRRGQMPPSMTGTLLGIERMS